MPGTLDVAVVGGGILGLAIAREVLLRRPGAKLAVFEREASVATHQSGHNSGVIHRGVYYKPGSLKARLCTEGSRLMLDYCAHKGIPVSVGGKLIVAVNEIEAAALKDLATRAQANGVDVDLLSPGQILELEPHCRGALGLHSPETAVTDFAVVALAIKRDVEDAGGEVRVNEYVEATRSTPRGVVIDHTSGSTLAGQVAFCAGPWADRLAIQAGAPMDPRIVPIRGRYLFLKPHRSHLVKSMIYPVPNLALPFLGVHFTRHIDGRVSIGPTATLSLARDVDRKFSARDIWETMTWPGTYRMAKRTWAVAVDQLRTFVSRDSILERAATMIELYPDDVEPGFSGVRAQAVSRHGHLVDDFVFSRSARMVHVRNAPSPAASSCFAIGKYVVDLIDREGGLAGSGG